jgi:predicted Zn-dependent protease
MKRLIAVLSLALASSAAAQTHVATQDQEIALGAALSTAFNNQRGVVPQSPEDLRIQAYLQKVADSLAVHARKKLPWTIHYDPHPAIKSGFALPGGHIVIWGGVLAYMTTEDELAAVIAHEMEHVDDDQVSNRLDSLAKANNLDVNDPTKWRWQWFGASQGVAREALCDYKGAKLMVEAGYSPKGLEQLLQTYVVLSDLKTPEVNQQVIKDRVTQIRNEIAEMHWEGLTKTRPIRLP